VVLLGEMSRDGCGGLGGFSIDGDLGLDSPDALNDSYQEVVDVVD
jgi:hypothetical protein